MSSPAICLPLARCQPEGSGPILLAQGLSNPKNRVWIARDNTLYGLSDQKERCSKTQFPFKIEHLQATGLHVLVAGGIELRVLDWQGFACCTHEYAISILCGDRNCFAYCVKGSPDKICLNEKHSAEVTRVLTTPEEVSHMTLCNHLLATHSANSGVTVWNIEDSLLCLYKIESPVVDQLFFLPNSASVAIRSGHDLMYYQSTVLEMRVNVDSCSANPYAVCSLLGDGSDTQVSINGYSKKLPGSLVASAATTHWVALVTDTGEVALYSLDHLKSDCTIL